QAIQDQNNNRRADRREAYDTVTVALDTSASALLWAFVHDTVGPRVKSVDPVDSVSFRLTFTAALDPRRPVDTAQVRVFALPDTTPFPVRTLYGAAQYDSIQARARAVADSLRKARDTTAKRDTTGRPGAAAPSAAAQRAPAAPRPAAPGRPAAPPHPAAHAAARRGGAPPRRGRGGAGAGGARGRAARGGRRARRGLGRRRARPRAPAGGAVARARDQRDGRGAAYEPRPSAARRARDRGDGPHRGIVLESRI